MCLEYFKHFTTITTAAAGVELALYQQLGLTTASALWGVGTLSVTLLLCVRGLVLLSVGAVKEGFSPISRGVRRLMVSTSWLFLLGVVVFVLAALSTSVDEMILNINHLLYELAKSMAQNIR